MSNLLGGRAGLSAEMAIRFEKAFGLSADTLVRMQAAHDLAQVRAREAAIEVERVGGRCVLYPQRSPKVLNAPYVV